MSASTPERSRRMRKYASMNAKDLAVVRASVERGRANRCDILGPMLALIDRYRTALEFYANPEAYGSNDKSRSTGNECYDIVCFDFDRNFKPRQDYAGARARTALSEEVPKDV